MKRRRELINRPTPRPKIVNDVTDTTNERREQRKSMVTQGGGGNTESSSAQQKANEAKQAVVLFIIVLLFFICHTPRFIINVHEFLNLDVLKRGLESDCDTFPIWAFAATSVSNCLMTLNSGSNFYIYCFMCATFRNVLRQWILQFCNMCSCICWNKIYTALPSRRNITTDQQLTIALNTVDTNIDTASTRKLEDSNLVDIDGKRVEVSCANDTKSDNPDEIFHTNRD